MLLRAIAAALLPAIGAALVAWGALRLRALPPAAELRETRRVAVRDAAAAADGVTPARLQGTLVAAPALLAPDGREYALQLLAVTPPATGDGGADAPGWARVRPATVFLSDGDSVVVVEPDDLDASYLPLLAGGRTGARGRLPPEVAMHLVPGFADLPADSGAAVALRGIRTGVPVAAYGTLVLREGVPSLARPATGDPYVLSTESFTAVERDLRSRARLARLGPWVRVVLGALLVLFAIARARR